MLCFCLCFEVKSIIRSGLIFHECLTVSESKVSNDKFVIVVKNVIKYVYVGICFNMIPN